MQGKLNRRSYLKHGALVTAGVATLAGCMGGGEDEPGGDQVVYYGSSARQEVFDAFEEETGISVEPVTAPGWEPLARFQTEEQQGEHTADILQQPAHGFTDEEVLELISEINMLDEHRNIYPDDLNDQIDERLPEQVQDRILIAQRSYYASGYSPDVESPPETWDEILDSGLEDSIMMPDFTADTLYWALTQWQDEDYAEEFFEGLDDLGIQFMGGTTSEVTDSVIAGETDFGLFVTEDSAISPLLQDGAPIEPFFGEMTTYSVSAFVKSANAPNPDAADEFLEFVLTEEAETAHTKGGAGRPSIRDDVPHGNSEIQEMIDEVDEFIPVLPEPGEFEYAADRVSEITGL